MQYAYYVMFWHCLSPASLMAVYLTNFRESMDFIHSNVGPVPTLLIVCGIGLFLWWAYRCHLQFARRMEAADGAAHPSQFVSLVLVFLAAAIALRFTVPETSIAGQWKDVNSYVEQTQTYSVTHDDRFAELKVDGTQTLAAKAPGTVIVVIGESASRNYMKAFTPDYAYDNTPWLSQMANNGDFTLFQNVYSSWSQTVPVLQRVLTEQSQYNDKEFFESNSIVDVAKKAGYHTYWFSNQGRYGQYDSAITLVAKTADVAAWTDDSYNFSDKYDEELLPYLAQVDPTQNNFLVLHIMGSHIYYNNRYPKDYEVFQTEDGESSLSSEPSYANSILYTDHVLQQIYEYAKQNLHLQAMLYFSDHGENLAISHNPDVFSFDMVRIPMFVYLSPEYRAALPTQALALWGHRSRYFTNDMLYDTISGLLNAPSNHYDAGQNLSSAPCGQLPFLCMICRNSGENSIDFRDRVTALFQRAADAVDVLLVVRLHRHGQHDLLETVRDHGLIVVQPDDIRALISEDLRYRQQLTRLVRKLYREAEDTAARDEGLIDEG